MPDTLNLTEEKQESGWFNLQKKGAFRTEFRLLKPTINKKKSGDYKTSEEQRAPQSKWRGSL